MVSNTDNHEYQLFADDEEPWEHRTDFEALDIDVEIRDTDANKGNYTAKSGALYLATDTGQIYLGDGSTWNPEWDLGAIGSGGSGDLTSADGIADTRTHVGPFPEGTYHSSSNRWGIAFWAASGLDIHSCVIDADLSATNLDTLTVELHEVSSRATNVINTNGSIDSTTTGTLSGGTERINLGFTIPSDGEYALCPNPETDGSGNDVPLRYDDTGWTGWGDYSDRTGLGLDLLQGGKFNTTTSSDYDDHYFYFFDIEAGTQTTSVTSPWSHDVEEIYMRPRDPAEQYDVSPRSLWFDTS